MSNSSLVSYTKLSPNHSGQRTHAVDRITPHCVVGQCSVETLGNIFAPTSKQASCQYGIGVDGRVGMYVEEKNRSCQTAFGYGRCESSNSSAIAPGTMNSKGMFWGSNDQTSGVKVFGMENWWGNLWRRTAGYINASGTQKVKLTRGTHDGSTATDYNTDGSGYISVAKATPSGTFGGYISSMKTEAYGRLPVTASGSSSTFEADGMWFNNSQSNYASFGGDWDYGLLVGPFCAFLTYAASDSGSRIGAALSCKPLAAA